MAAVTLTGVGKVYPDGTRAVTALDLAIADGELMVIVGPSGCGKTTTLRMTAGLEEISEGELRIGERVVNGLDARQRDVAMVFQNYALYPHMTVLENLAFPLRARGLPRAVVQARVERTAKLLGLDSLLRRKPRALSGGQRQRVAMGRAIIREPQVFLMDEPLSNLDAKLRTHMRAEIAGLQRELGVTTMYVTHDQVEAMTMGTRIAVMRDGVLQQLGPPQELYDRPGNLFVAAFVGSPTMNLLRGRIERDGSSVAVVVGEGRLRLAADSALAAALAGYDGGQVAVGIRPEHLGGPGASSGSLRLRGRVVFSELLGPERLVQIELDARPLDAGELLELALEAEGSAAPSLGRRGDGRAVVTARLDAHVRSAPGELAEVALAGEHLHFFDLATGRAIRS
jgi:multiple sugar transport system ATP-binding protein